jgi:hypothetical protein
MKSTVLLAVGLMLATSLALALGQAQETKPAQYPDRFLKFLNVGDHIQLGDSVGNGYRVVIYSPAGALAKKNEIEKLQADRGLPRGSTFARVTVVGSDYVGIKAEQQDGARERFIPQWNISSITRAKEQADK